MISFENTEIAFQSKSDKDLNRAYMLFSIMNYQRIVHVGKILLQIARFLRLPVKFMIKSTIFKHFCGGETMKESDVKIKELADYNVHTILDYSVEGKESEKDFDAAFELIKKTVDNAALHKEIPFAVFKPTGMGRLALLEKVSLKKTLKPKEEEEYKRVQKRIEGICQRGFDNNIPILIDAEESWIQLAIDEMIEVNMKKFNKERAIVYNTVQLYRHDRLQYLNDSINKARAEGYFYGIKLVRGAYMEKERDRAKKMGYPSPINATKADTDRDFNGAIKACIDNVDIVSVCCGSHNEDSNQYMVTLLAENNLKPNDSRVYFAQLLGMSDHISYNLSHAGYNVAKYVPFGPVYDVMPYLIRRTEENSSISGQSSRELSLLTKERNRRKLGKSA